MPYNIKFPEQGRGKMESVKLDENGRLVVRIPEKLSSSGNTDRGSFHVDPEHAPSDTPS